jgi:hypothetical protein
MTDGILPKPRETGGGPKRGRAGQFCPPSGPTDISTERRAFAPDLLQMRWSAINDSSVSCGRWTDATPTGGAIADRSRTRLC